MKMSLISSKTFITIKYPELSNNAIDILITRTFLILSDYLEQCLGIRPQFNSPILSDEGNEEVSADSDCDFEKSLVTTPIYINEQSSNNSEIDEAQNVGSGASYQSVLPDMNTRVEKNLLTPKKHGFRQKMRSNLEKQQNRMMKNQKGRKKRVTFEKGALVSASIPKEDRGKIEYRRLKGVVVDTKDYKRGFRKYRVATEFGTLDGWLSVEQLREYNGKVNLTLTKEHSITIREAARMNSIRKGNCCNCENGCVDRRCGCRKYSFRTKMITKCGTQCHKGKPCGNQVVDTILPVFPAYGGYYIKDCAKIIFSNTCSIDCWIALFKVIQSEHPEKLELLIRENSTGKNSTIMVFLGYVRHGCFERAKMLLAELCNIPLYQNTYDFYGNEIQNVLRHLTFLLENVCTSQCSNDNLCPERVKSDEMNDFPCVPNVHNDNEFETFIVNWLIEIKETPCRLELLNNNSCGINAQWIPKW